MQARNNSHMNTTKYTQQNKAGALPDRELGSGLGAGKIVRSRVNYLFIGALAVGMAIGLAGCSRASAPSAITKNGQASGSIGGSASNPTSSAASNPSASNTHADGTLASKTPTSSTNQDPTMNMPKPASVPSLWADLPTDPKTGALIVTEAQWKERLGSEQYRVLRQKGTERAFSGKHWNSNEPGEYRCAACGQLLFVGDSKFLSDCGWPAFDKCIAGSIDYIDDSSFGMVRTEVVCNRCKSHLGHVFNDGPTDTGTRYCINSVSIAFISKSEIPAPFPGQAAPKQESKTRP